MDQERLAFLALHQTPGIGDYLLKQLISYGGSAEQIFKTPIGKLLKIPGVGKVTAEAIRSGKLFDKAEKEITKAEKTNTEILFFNQMVDGANTIDIFFCELPVAFAIFLWLN